MTRRRFTRRQLAAIWLKNRGGYNYAQAQQLKQPRLSVKEGLSDVLVLPLSGESGTDYRDREALLQVVGGRLKRGENLSEPPKLMKQMIAVDYSLEEKDRIQSRVKLNEALEQQRKTLSPEEFQRLLSKIPPGYGPLTPEQAAKITPKYPFKYETTFLGAEAVPKRFRDEMLSATLYERPPGKRAKKSDYETLWFRKRVPEKDLDVTIKTLMELPLDKATVDNLDRKLAAWKKQESNAHLEDDMVALYKAYKPIALEIDRVEDELAVMHRKYGDKPAKSLPDSVIRDYKAKRDKVNDLRSKWLQRVEKFAESSSVASEGVLVRQIPDPGPLKAGLDNPYLNLAKERAQELAKQRNIPRGYYNAAVEDMLTKEALVEIATVARDSGLMDNHLVKKMKELGLDTSKLESKEKRAPGKVVRPGTGTEYFTKYGKTQLVAPEYVQKVDASGRSYVSAVYEKGRPIVEGGRVKGLREIKMGSRSTKYITKEANPLVVRLKELRHKESIGETGSELFNRLKSAVDKERVTGAYEAYPLDVQPYKINVEVVDPLKVPEPLKGRVWMPGRRFKVEEAKFGKVAPISARRFHLAWTTLTGTLADVKKKLNESGVFGTDNVSRVTGVSELLARGTEPPGRAILEKPPRMKPKAGKLPALASARVTKEWVAQERSLASDIPRKEYLEEQRLAELAEYDLTQPKDLRSSEQKKVDARAARERARQMRRVKRISKRNIGQMERTLRKAVGRVAKGKRASLQKERKYIRALMRQNKVSTTLKEHKARVDRELRDIRRRPAGALHLDAEGNPIWNLSV